MFSSSVMNSGSYTLGRDRSVLTRTEEIDPADSC